MKTARKSIAFASKTALVLCMIALQSCGTYNTQMLHIENDLYTGHFDKAIKGIDGNSFLKKDKNRLLYLLEKGKVEHLRGNYTESNAILEEAYIMVDDKINTSTVQYIAAKFTNPMAEPYKGEDFEKVTIHYYKALNYFMMGRPDEALVEAKRINIKLYELNEKYTENKNKYSEDAFSHVLQGIIYESVADINNAFIAYRNAEEIYAKNKDTFFGVPMPQQLKEDLLRTSFQMGFRDEYQGYLKKFGKPKDYIPAKPAAGEAILFWENGLGPAKDQVIITASGKYGAFVGTYNDGEISEPIIIPIPSGVDIGVINAIAIPKYRKRESFYSKATVLVNGNEQPLELAQDFYPIAKQCLKDRMMREVMDLVVRFAAKKATGAGIGAVADKSLGGDWGEVFRAAADIAGAATEKADTRNWQTLPATIGYTRIPLTEGSSNTFTIKKYGPQGVVDTDNLTIPFKRGSQIVNYYDLGRTQVTPAVTQSATQNIPPVVSPKSD